MEMTEAAQLGYAQFWKRMSMHIGLSEAAKAIGGIKASQLSAFEQGKEHSLTSEEIERYIAFLDQRKAEEPPHIPTDDELPVFEDEE
jgi:hypothetical protein